MLKPFANTPIKTPFVLSALSLVMMHAYADNEPSVYLGEITATTNATPIKNTIAQTIVINKDDLKHYEGQSVLDVLKSTGTISYYTNGGRGKTSNFYLRGYDGKQILVLIDGVRYSSMTTGAPTLTVLPADQIERIEIVHGASGSSVYGADAMGGVVQIFTKKADTDNKNIALTLGTGSHQQQYYGVNLGVNTGNTRVNLSASQDKSDGFNATTQDNKWAYNADDDGFDSKNASVNLSHDFGAVQIGGSALHSQVTSEFDNGDTPQDVYGKHKVLATNSFATWRYAPSSSATIKYGKSQDDYTAFDGKDFATGRLIDVFNTKQTQANLTINHDLKVGKLLLGAEELKQSVNSTNTYDINNRTIDSGFVGYQLTQDRLDGTAFVRHTHNSQFGNKTTYNAGLAYRVLPNVRVGASYATGFRVPTLNEMYDTTYGSNNPNLRPETTKNTEAFVEFDKTYHRTRITGYHNDVSNMIAWQAKPTQANTYAGQNININQAKIQGLSLTSDWNVGNYLFGISYDYQDSKNTTPNSATLGNKLAIRPMHKGTSYVGYKHNSFDVRAEYQRFGSYYSNVANLPSQKVAGYGLVNLSGTYKFNDHISARSAINNLFNKKYHTLPGYAEDDINFYTSVSFKY